MNSGWEKLTEYKIAGTYTWKAPDLFNGKAYKIGVLVVGGGASGDSYSAIQDTASYLKTTGGCSGDLDYGIIEVLPNTNANIIVGAGGKPASTETRSGFAGGSSNFGSGASGNESSFTINGLSMKARGGSRGGSSGELLCGGQLFYDEVDQLYGGKTKQSFYSPAEIRISNTCMNIFESRNILGAGGYANASKNAQKSGKGGKNFNNVGGGNGLAYYNYYGDTAWNVDKTAQSADEYGSGGGGVCAIVGFSPFGSGVVKATSGAGADGAVIIYTIGMNM